MIKFLIFSLFILNNQAFATSPESSIQTCKAFSGQLQKEKNESKKLKLVMDFIWGQWMKEYPTWATFVGFSGYDDLWPDESLENILNRKKMAPCHLQLLKKINLTKLSQNDKINYKLFLKKINSQIKESEFPSEYLVLDQMNGIHLEIMDIIDTAPKLNKEDFENRLKRLDRLDVYIDQNIILLEEGLKRKVTPVKFLIKKVPAQIQALIFSNPKESPLYKVFQEMPTHISSEEKSKLLSKAESLISSKVHPALKKLKSFIEEKYLPFCREEISFSSLPQGSQWYHFLVEKHTTTSKTAKEIHELGLKEVTRIDQEMLQIRQKLNEKRSQSEFHQFLQTDPQFFFKTPKELINAYQAIAKEIDPGLIKLFSDLPKLPYGVKPMADYKAPSAPTAYYQPGSFKSGRAGYFEANTYNLNSRPKWEMEVLTLHEAVPGHHLQISMAQELGDLPEFRKHEFYTAYTEGWGLYSESLGDELGFYKDLYSKYGQLTYEMWRAVRLVVDTGIHSLNWSKEKALEYFMEHIPKNKLQSEVEIDRYIVMPGQALAYKIGELKIKELKKQAIKKLGPKFDIREFHKVVLQLGAVPLDLLEEEVNHWLEAK